MTGDGIAPDASLWDVVLAPYDDAWPRMFETVAAEIRAACPGAVLTIEHVGSTAIPGLAAKPVLDIEILAATPGEASKIIPALESLGYVADPASPIPEYHSLWRAAAEGRLQVNAAVHAADHPDGLRRIAFRDYLRAHPEAASRYAALKLELATQYPHDGSSYTGGKSSFIRRIRREIEGLGPDIISVVPYDAAWARMFESEATRIRAAAGRELLGLEHIGSTSVPGLPAKPIIDIMGLVASFDAGRHLVVPLRSIGYLYYGEHEIPGRHYFVLEDAAMHDVIHLHVLAVDSAEARNHVLFRNYLRAHEQVRDAYAALKQQLAIEHANDRRAYTDAKADFIRGMLTVARGADV